MRLTLPVASSAVLVSALALGACAGEGTGAYCDALRDARGHWATAGASLADRDAAARLVTSVRTIESSAPPEVRADWTRLRTFFERFAVDAPDLQDLTARLPSYEATAKRVEAHAQQACGVDLAG